MDAIEVAFVDPIRNAPCVLVVPPEGRVYPSEGESKIGVRHPDCEVLADLAIELDAFHCQSCGRGGRVSGGWAIDVIEGRVH